jgi:two-component sensor histidine kinase
MEFFTPVSPEQSSSLGMALVLSSAMPLLLLDDHMVIQAVSETFCRAFDLRRNAVAGVSLFALGDGEWNTLQLRSLLEATADGRAAIDAYEFVLKREGKPDRILILNAHALDHDGSAAIRLVLAVADITAMRDSEHALRAQAHKNDALVRDQQVLMQELNHRVANSLQIIASILMLRVKRSQSAETRDHLSDVHHRVLSIAKLQRLLASNANSDVALLPYLTDLCASIGASMIADPDKLTLNVTADESSMSPDQSVSLGLIVTELTINALKHAFPDANQRNCHIDVAFAASMSGWVLNVSDNGCGMVENPAKPKSGLGTGIVQALAGQLAATVDVADNEPGTIVTVRHVAVGSEETSANSGTSVLQSPAGR